MALTQIHGERQIQTLTITNDCIANDQITNAKINSAAAIAYSKLNLSNSIVNADIAAAAAIDFSKLASLTSGNILVGNGSNVATSVTVTGDVTISNAGVTAISAGVIVDADINASANIATSKLADGADFLQRDANATLSNGVRYTYSTAQTFAPVTDDNALVTKLYVDSVAQGLDAKGSVRALSDANIASLSGPTTIDGVSVVAGNRVLLTAQTTGSENGIWVVAAGAWARAADMAAGSSGAGAYTFVEEGTTYADSGWVCISNGGSDVVGTDSLSFTQFTGAGQITAGAGLTKTGNTLDVGDAGRGVQVNANDLEFSASEAAHASGGLEASANSWQLKIKLDGVTGGNNANVIKLTSDGASVGIDNSTITVSGGNLQVASGVVNAGTLDSLDSTDFLRSTASSSLAAANTLTVASGAFINFAVETGLRIGGTSLTTTITELNALGTIVVREVPTGAVDGLNDTFTLANTPIAGSEEVYVNGILQDVGGSNDYTITGGTITFTAGAIPQSGSKVRVSYRY